MIPILFQDSSLLFCCKPPDVLSQSGTGPNMPDQLRQETGKLVFPVHRLDRGVGGVMVYACSRPAAAALSHAVQCGDFQKQYLCIVRGRPAESSGTFQDLLLHDKVRNKSFVVKRMRGGVREATLSYQVLAVNGDLSLILVQPHTGRTHQIRVQFASRGMPLFGDGKYGGGNGGIALWSFSLAVPHPKTGKTLRFQALPDGKIWEPFPSVLAKAVNNASE